MASPMLERRLSASDAQARLRRLGAQHFEPLWVPLWAFPLGGTTTPNAWLLGAEQMPRALLLPGASLPAPGEPPPHETQLYRTTAPTAETLARQWLWERLNKPRLWRTRLLDEAPSALWLPCWIGYVTARQMRLAIISGLSGEALPMLKPLVLHGLKALSAQPSEEARHGAMAAHADGTRRWPAGSVEP